MRILFLGVVLVLAGAAPVRAGEPKLTPLQALGDITGDDAINARYRELVRQPAAAKKLITEGLKALAKKQPLDFNGAYLLAQTAAKLKDRKAAEAFFRVCTEQAVKLQSKNKILVSYGGLIDLFFNNKKYAESARVCRELLELKVDDGKPRHYLMEFNDPVKGAYFDELEKYDPLAPLRPGVHRLLIQSVAKQGKIDQALKMVDNLVREDNTWENLELKGMVLREANRDAEAAKVYEEVVDLIGKDQTLTPKGRDFYADRYRYLLSGIYVDANQIDKAADVLKDLIKRHPDEPGYYNDLGYIWADRDVHLAESERMIRKALELDRARQLKKNPNLKDDEIKGNGAYLDSLGWVLFKLKKYKEAKVELLKAVKDEDAQHLEIYDHLGDVYLALGERAAARKAWQRGLAVASDSRRDQQRKAEVEKKLEKFK